MDRILSLTLTELAQAYKQKSLAVSQVVQQVKAQIGVMQDLNALISVTSDERISKTTAAAQHRQDHDQMLGPLDGVPVVVKDNYCTSWSKTTCGSHMLSDYTPPYSATLVSRLEAAGAIIMGKSNMDEFGMGSGGINSVFGPSRNLYRSGKPYCLDSLDLRCGGLAEGAWLASGGSSGGSAVAVAAGMAYGALGSDTGGSVRNPAALCGLVGLKPSYGLLSRTGLVSLVNSMDCPGVLARSSADCAALFDALLAGGADLSDSTNYPAELKEASPVRAGRLEGLRVGVPAEYHCAGLQVQVLEAWRRVADVLSDSGARVEQVSLPHTPYAPSCYTVLNTCEVASNYTRYTGVEYGLQLRSGHSMEEQYALTRAAGLSQVVRDRILAGNYFLLRGNSDDYLQQAMKVRRLIKRDFDAVWRDGVDVLLTPTTLFPAPSPELFMVKNYSELTYLQDLCTSPANLAGLPALSLPVGYSAPSQNRPNDADEFLSNNVKIHNDTVDDQCNLSGSDVAGEEHHIEGLPLALQLIAPFSHDRHLLHIAELLEEALEVPRLVLQDPL